MPRWGAPVTAGRIDLPPLRIHEGELVVIGLPAPPVIHIPVPPPVPLVFGEAHAWPPPMTTIVLRPVSYGLRCPTRRGRRRAARHHTRGRRHARRVSTFRADVLLYLAEGQRPTDLILGGAR